MKTNLSQCRHRAALRLALFAIALLMSGIHFAAADAEAKEPAEFPLFAMDNGMTKIEPLEKKATVLKELGYTGIGWRPGNDTAAALAELKKHRLKMHTSYIGVTVDNDGFSVENAIKEIELLSGGDTRIWLVVRGQAETDESPVNAIGQIADKAAEAGLEVVLYPHVNCITDTALTCLRLAEKANRKNVGLSFNLCHFLKQNDERELADTLRRVAPFLRVVQVSGADSGNTKEMGWERLIQPVGQGSFEMSNLIRLLREIHYSGPVALMGYKIPGDDYLHLRQSIAAWNALVD
jgi:sugar phosphate isomerase/epimerase